MKLCQPYNLLQVDIKFKKNYFCREQKNVELVLVYRLLFM